MKRIFKFVVWIGMSIFMPNMINGQMADIKEGCLPLKVNFNSPSASNYYWDFNDGTFATEQNPTHIFTKAGHFKVLLKDSPTGAIKGEISIDVYEKPVLTVTADTLEGCAPRKINFVVNVQANPAIITSEYKWTFGDGAATNAKSPSYTYNKPGIFDVAIGIKTNFVGCDVTKINPKFALIHGVVANFNIVAVSECNAPYIYDFKNTTLLESGNVYTWDFGNGNKSDLFDAGSQNYNQAGEYKVLLKVTDKFGCEDTIVQTLSAGKPSIKLSLKRDSICLDERVVVSNTSAGNKFFWTFDASASIPNSILRNPQWHYKTPGLKSVKLKIGSDNACVADTSFVIYVEPEPNAAFTFTPMIGCKNPHEITVVADDKTHSEYVWQKSNISGSAIDKVIITDPKRDSLYMHYRDTVFLFLKIKTAIGCPGESRDTAYYQRPDAYFLTTKPSGCVPLTVEFSDASFTHVPIKSIKWIFGDGQSMVQNNTNKVSHSYTKVGEYYAKSIIENLDGCIDTSAGLIIKVGDHLAPKIAIDKTDICLGDTVNISFLNTESVIDGFHVLTDDGRFDQCWTKKQASHSFVHSPGTYPIVAQIDYNGCLTEQTHSIPITVKGAKANIGYMINCGDPMQVMFNSKSIGADFLKWKILDSTLIDSSFQFVFDSTGDYNIKLWASNSQDNCPADSIVQTVFIRQIKANFALPDEVCDTDVITLDASKSQDVNADCSKGYLWNYSYQRPIETVKAKRETSIPPGDQSIQLIVEDVNGCRDTVEHHVKSYGIYPKISTDKLEFCVPFDLKIKDLSTSDAPISKWQWSTGHTTKDLETTITNNNDDLKIFLKLEDVKGCKDSISVTFVKYQPVSDVHVLPNSILCLGDDFLFDATDYTEKGSHLSYQWNFGDGDMSTLQSPKHTYTKAGTYTVATIYQEVASGCKDTTYTQVKVVQPPVAIFTSPEDNKAVICHPKIMDFTNHSQVDGDVIYHWKLGKNISLLKDPSEAFPKGTHEVSLIVNSIYGCADTLTKFYTLVGPEGKIQKDKNRLCTNEKLTLQLTNPVDVNQFTWQFGDGTTYNNENPLVKSFDLDTSIHYLPIELILKSEQNGCNLIVRDSILFDHVVADFAIVDTALCYGQVSLINHSKGASSYQWSLGDNNKKNGQNIEHVYSSAGLYAIQLIATGTNQNCRDTIVKNYELDQEMDIVLYPNIFTPNGDGENDLFTAVVPDEFKDKMKVTTLKIFNRWGHLVSDSPVWDGKIKGDDAPAEVYAYYMEVEFENCRKYTKKGNITLIR